VRYTADHAAARLGRGGGLDRTRGEQSHVSHATRLPLDRLTWARWRRAVLNVMRSEVGGGGSWSFEPLQSGNMTG
jgi:hypothetical protein